MQQRYQPLFTPYTLNNGVTVRNRLAVAPLTHFSSSADGTLSTEERTFLKDRARGFGIFITAATLVSREGQGFPGQPFAFSREFLPSLKETASLIKNQGALALLQIHHAGALTPPQLLEGTGLQPLAPSDEGCARAMTEAEVQHTISAYAAAAGLALEAGFDGVEIHGANGYLLQQFYSGKSNRRTDAWGGSREKRMRVPLEVAKAVLAVKEQAGRGDFIIGYRFSPEEEGEHGLDMQDTYALLDELCKLPLQYLHLSLHDFYRKVRRGDDPSRLRVRGVHERIGGALPLMAVGGLYTGDDFARAFETGCCEFLAAGRSVLINPGLAEKIEQGREDEIETVLDPDRPDHYGLPSWLWNSCCTGNKWRIPLPKTKQAAGD